MKLEISRSVIDAIVTESDRVQRREVCGLLLGSAEYIDGFLTCDNVAADPRSAFEIDPAQLIAAYRAERRGGRAIVGCFHSHPVGAPEPSPADAASAAANGWIWLIVAGRGIGVWRAVEQGSRYGRFDTVHWQSV